MAQDNISHAEATNFVHETIEKAALGGNIRLFGLLPYRMGLLSVGALALSTSPLVFHHDTVLWFNEAFVTADVPEPKDLETVLEVFVRRLNEKTCGQDIH